LKFNIISLFPEMFGAIQQGVVGQAVKNQKITLNLINPRSFTSDIHKTVDDRPYGGGDGMVMMGEPLEKALESIGQDRGHVVYLSPHGKVWNDKLAREWALEFKQKPLTLICGRYGGIDQRFINTHVNSEISVGDFVLSGGEIAAMTVIDTLARLVPGVLGNAESSEAESFAEGLLESPQFTRPQELYGQAVPEALRGGNHKKIREFRQMISLLRTLQLRPDLPLAPAKIAEAVKYATALPDSELEACGLGRKEEVRLWLSKI
jgi:tRNA (guanine37-N1)-methyltransferase